MEGRKLHSDNAMNISSFRYVGSVLMRCLCVTPLQLLVLVLAGCGASSAETRPEEDGHQDGHQGAIIGQPAPDLLLTALNGGKNIRLSELKGKVVLLDVWASWCAPCKEELPMLDDMAARLRKKGVEIVAVSVDENRQDAEAFVQERPSWSIQLAHDPEGKVPGALQPPKMPSSYVIDRAGVIRDANFGFSRDDAEKIEARLVELADAPSEAVASAPPKGNDTPAADSPVASSPEAASHPVPAVSGLIDGRPFAPKLARVAGRMKKDGRILLSLSERTDCALSHDLKPGDATLTMVLPWKDGSKADLGSLKRATKRTSGAIAFGRINAAKKKEVSSTFKPTGTVTIESAPMQQNGFGKMKIDLVSGNYTLSGDLDIQVCVPPK
jgi:thiol-disulfide isomerase/thioredoxin